MGHQQGEAANFNWKWYYSSGFVIWLVLILAVVIPKANRNLHILWLFIPLVILNQLWLAIKQVSGVSSSSGVQFDTLFQSMVMGIAVLWLMANYLGKLGSIVRFFFSFGTVVIVANLGILPYYAGFTRDTFLFSVLFAVMPLALLLAMTISSLLCRRQYKPCRFLLWLGLWILVGSTLAVSVFYTVLILATGTNPSWSDFPQMIFQLAIPGLIFGLFLYVLNLPFMILGFAHPFFRERFCACLSLEPEIPIVASRAD